ncbi:MAG: hypothetical protein CUN52_13605, partial [Phototrophicales bacterium]
MRAFIKYSRAFWKTLRLLMNGGKIPEEAHMDYRRWSERTVALVATVFATSDKHGITVDRRDTLTTRIDGREMSLQTILQAVAYHAKEEYVYLLRNFTDQSLTTIQATNMNDEYALSRFIENS